MSSLSRSTFPGDRRRGIALLVTVILLAFLILIVVALSSLVRVETQIAVNQDVLAQARQNALFGINMAVGRLQEVAGPDRRVTARADILPGAANNPYLTGVWDSSGNLITWLVNGNEDHDLNPGAPKITPTSPAAEILDPTDDSAGGNPITAPLFNDTAPNATGAAANPRFGPGHVYLVSGRQDSTNENVGSVDIRGNTNANGSHAGYKDGAAERIILRKSPITVDGSSVPGKAAGTEVSVGNYAFWVADDGIKASIGSGNRAGTLNYDDSVSGGVDYDNTPAATAANAATNPSYLARKFLNSLQLQATRTELVLRDNTGTDLFRLIDRRALYGVLPHPEAASLMDDMFSVRQVNNTPMVADFTSTAPIIDTGTSNIPNDLTAFQVDLRDRLRQRFHDITPKSRGVLTDMVTGGLREDLTYELANGFPTLGAGLQSGVQNFMNVWRPANGVVPLDNATPEGWLGLISPIVPPPETAITAAPTNTAYFPVVPVITEFELRMELTVNAAGELKAGFTSALELWNPYNVTLQVPAGQSLYITIPILREDNTPYLTNLTVGDGVVNEPLDVALTMGWDGMTAATGDTVLVYKIVTSGNQEWGPGQVRIWQLDALVQKDAKRPDTTVINGMAPGATVNVASNDESVLSVALHMGNASNLADPVLFANDTTPLFAVSGLRYAVAGSEPSGGAIYYFQLNDQRYFDDNDPGTVWLDIVEPRGPVIYPSGADEIFRLVPITAIQAERGFFDSLPQVLQNEDHGNPRVVLYDLPRQEVTGMGAFEHFAFSGTAAGTNSPSYVLGRPNVTAMGAADSRNNLFENYFISTVPRGKTGAPDNTGWFPRNGDLLANTSLRIFDPVPVRAAGSPVNDDLLEDLNGGPGGATTGLQTARAAEYLLIEDAFNINSTSVAAWMGVLGGALPALADPAAGVVTDRSDYFWASAAAPASASTELKANWRYRDDAGNAATMPLANVFFRIPNTATDLGEDYVTLRDQLDDANTDPRYAAAFRLGLREFTKDQIEVLATQVVNQIRTRGRPFLSLAEFIDSGVLQNAINVAALNRLPSGNDIPARSTAFLSQNDILQLILPRLAARSDTFTIRAYGDVLDPISGSVKARAWAEATVQRIPVKHPSADDPADNMTSTGEAPGNFGRQFKIVNVRWLDPSEI